MHTTHVRTLLLSFALLAGCGGRTGTVVIPDTPPGQDDLLPMPDELKASEETAEEIQTSNRQDGTRYRLQRAPHNHNVRIKPSDNGNLQVDVSCPSGTKPDWKVTCNPDAPPEKAHIRYRFSCGKKWVGTLRFYSNHNEAARIWENSQHISFDFEPRLPIMCAFVD